LYIPKGNDVGHPISPETNSTADSSMTAHVENCRQIWSMVLKEYHLHLVEYLQFVRQESLESATSVVSKFPWKKYQIINFSFFEITKYIYKTSPLNVTFIGRTGDLTGHTFCAILI
jgi:D-ribose pyranose/furanose isomerase RbsD